MKYYFILLILVFSCAQVSPPTQLNETQVRIASLNFKIQGEQTLSQHLERIETWTVLAKKQDASFLLLPELMVLDLLPQNPSKEDMPRHLDALAQQANAYEKFLSKLSEKHKISIVGASVVVKDKNHYLNRAFYINPLGQVAYQDKMKPTPWEVGHGFMGSKDIRLFNDEKFTFTILICHDAEFPSISAQMSKLKPEIIFVPSQTDDLYGLNRVKLTSAARAIEQMSYVVMTGASGNEEAPWHSYVGQNFLFTPQNKYFPKDKHEGPFNREGLSFFTVDLRYLRAARGDPKQVYPARDEDSYN